MRVAGARAEDLRRFSLQDHNTDQINRCGIDPRRQRQPA
jgi:hypothetical protein